MIGVKNEELLAAAARPWSILTARIQDFESERPFWPSPAVSIPVAISRTLPTGPQSARSRCAIFSGIAQGERRFIKLAVVSSGDGYPWPCGICRQVMLEFMPPEGSILLEDKGKILELALDELMPHGFTKEALSSE